jgi:hypothetical protein
MKTLRRFDIVPPQTEARSGDRLPPGDIYVF